MSASKLNPYEWKGEERSGGYLARNTKPTSAKAPHWKGKLYISGVGWYWLSAWEKDGREDVILTLSPQEMTDDHARKFCAPRGQTGEKPARQKPSGAADTRRNGNETVTTEIPF